MVDTPRTVTDLITNLFQDGQPASSITPNDMRDFIVSLQESFGAYHLNTALETTIVTQSVFVKIAGGTIAFANNVDFSTPVDNRLVYDGTLTKTFALEASLTMTSAANNQTIGLAFAINGVVDTTTIQEQRLAMSVDPFTVSLTGHVRMVQNDFLEVFVSNETGTANVTMSRLNATVRGTFDD